MFQMQPAPRLPAMAGGGKSPGTELPTLGSLLLLQDLRAPTCVSLSKGQISGTC